MLNTGRAVQALVAQVSELTTQVQLLRSPAAPPTPPSFSIPGNHSPQHEPRLPAPEMYAGDPNLCRAFLTKCSLFFSLQPLTFATEVSRVALVLTLLSGRAALWGTAVWENRHPCCSSFHSLSQEMRRVFDRALVGREAARMRANQDLERVLRCLVTQNPTSWCQQLSWVEYAHNSLQVSSTGLSPFECSLGYQPPLFPSMESEVAVPSAHAFVQRCHRTWTRARETLLRVGACTKAKADRHRSKPPVYVVGQKCGFLPRTFRSDPCVISWLPNLLARFLSLKLLVR